MRPCWAHKEKAWAAATAQAFLLTQDPAHADPVCDRSPHHHLIQQAVETAAHAGGAAVEAPLVF